MPSTDPSAPMRTNRFSDEYATLHDYILGITERIWEGRDVGLIHRYYGRDCWVMTQGGIVTGVDPVVSGTLETLHQFPDRTLLGEDVVWADHGPGRGLLSSHRILTTGTHWGDGPFGKATGRPIVIRAIADCLVKAGTDQITEEWLIRDGAGIALQIGQDPEALGRGWGAADKAAGKAPWHLDQWEAVRAGEAEATAFLMDHPAAVLSRGLFDEIVNCMNLAAVRERCDRAISAHMPRHRELAGAEMIERWWLSYLAALPDAKLVIDHAIALEEPGQPIRTSTRWRLAGTHTGHGAFGRPTGARVLIMGITQHHVVNGRITKDWTLVDEVAVHRMIGLQIG
jgi:predicted ester cyclase